MGQTLFASIASGPGPRTRRAAVPVSIGAHAVAVAALMTLPLLAGSTPPVAARLVDPPVLVLPAPPAAEASRPSVVRPSASRPRSSAPPAAAVATPGRPTIAIPTGIPTRLPGPDDDAVSCVGCALSTASSVGGGGAPASAIGVPGPAGDGTAPLRVGGRIRTPLKLRHVDPEYPPLARAARVQGTVVVECVIGVDGRITGARVIDGKPLLNEAALAAVRQWAYRPTLLDGTPVAVQMTVRLEFHLR